MDDEISQITAQRRNRINKMKKIIIITMFSLIIIPIILCIILTAKVCSLENKLDELIYAKSQGKITAMTDNNNKQTTPENENQSGSIASQDQETTSKENISNEENTTAAKETTVTSDDTVLETDTTLEKDDASNKPGYGKTVCLTFDDGPSENTDLILDILDEYNVKATFFVVGSTRKEDIERYKKIVEKGHSIGLHTYSHDYNYIYASVDNFIEDVNKIHDIVYEATGKDVRLFRFPGGSANSTVDKIDIHDCIKYLNENGYTYYDWNVSSKDATAKEQTVEFLMKSIEDDLYKFDTSVILMHDSIYKTTTVKMLPQLIEKLLDEGFLIKPIDDSVTKIQQIRDHK